MIRSKWKPLMLLLFIAVSLLCCTKDKIKDSITVSCNRKTGNIDSVRQLIAGTYDWVYTYGIADRTGQEYIEIPANSGQRRRYIFDNQGAFRYYESDTLNIEYRYTIGYNLEDIGNLHDSSAVITVYDKHTDQEVYHFRPKICNDSTVFISLVGYGNLAEEHLVRKK